MEFFSGGHEPATERGRNPPSNSCRKVFDHAHRCRCIAQGDGAAQMFSATLSSSAMSAGARPY
jgi:hypothetical protein